MKNKRIAKILGIGLSAGLIFALLGAVFAAPVAAGDMEWSTVNTPDWGDRVVFPGTDIIDYDIGGDGDVIYAVLEMGCGWYWEFDEDTDVCHSDLDGYIDDYNLVKSEDGGVTWTDIMGNVFGAASKPDSTISTGSGGQTIDTLWFVSVAPDDEDWVAVVGRSYPDNEIWVYASDDGGDNFTFAGIVEDPGADELDYVLDLDVSLQVDSIHNIAVAGQDNTGDGTIFRLKAGTWLSASWEDTGDDYLGWDTTVEVVVACEFSDNFDLDDTIVCLGCDGDQDDSGGQAVIQSGMWESGGGSWNDEAGFPESKIIDADGELIHTNCYNRQMGLALPADYDGTDPSSRAIFMYINGLMWPTAVTGGWVIRSDDYALSPVCGPPGDPLLASIDVHGDADTGKLMIGEFFEWDDADMSHTSYGSPIDVFDGEDYCGGVSVWHTEELDFCCPQWDGACKDPSGPYMALVRYTPDGDKAYATTSGTFDMDQDDGNPSDGYGDVVDDWYSGDFDYADGTPEDESAFSVSRDDGVSFNQLGLIDTDIDYLSDVVVCPDCGTIYLATVNDYGGSSDPCNDDYSDCDSVWRSYDDGDTWERVNHGDWSNDQADRLLLRVPCDAIEDCCDQDPVEPMGTVYLAIQGDDEVYYSRDCGQCWNNPPATKEDIQDIAVESENIVYVLDEDGGVSKSTQYGRRWSDPVDTDIGSGHAISACCEQGFVVVGGTSAGKVAWSDDGGESFTLTDALPSLASGEVHPVCDPVCDNIIYAAVNGEGIFRTDITDGSWTDLEPLPYDYTGIVMAREGTLYASTDEITVDMDGDDTTLFTDCKDRDMVAPNHDTDDEHYSGVARNLTPCETDCCGTEDWDYLFCGLTPDDDEWWPFEDFDTQPNALRICGCLSAATNSVLFAIDRLDSGDRYIMDPDDSSFPEGALWSYEDCAAKAGPTLTAPADEAVLDCEACAGCGAAPFTLKWERMCEACSYDINIMDEDGNLIIELVDQEITGDPPELYLDPEAGELKIEITGSTVTITSMGGDSLECGNTYTWKVREANTACECVHSPWSETWSFTIAVGTADAIELLAPDEGALGVPIANVGFSWTSVPDASSYSFVLSPNAALTGALVSQDLSSTAFNFAGPLDNDMAYYWQVKAWKDSVLLTTSAIGVFNTGSKPVVPPPPVVVEPTPAPIIEIPPVQQITPTWIYAIIGIGAALAVVVIVLIVRTRRP